MSGGMEFICSICGHGVMTIRGLAKHHLSRHGKNTLYGSAAPVEYPEDEDRWAALDKQRLQQGKKGAKAPLSGPIPVAPRRLVIRKPVTRPRVSRGQHQETSGTSRGGTGSRRPLSEVSLSSVHTSGRDTPRPQKQSRRVPRKVG